MATLKHYHVTLTIEESESEHSWYDPRAQRSVSFSIPVEMFSATNFSKLIDKEMKELEKDFEEESKKYYEEKAKKEKAERLNDSNEDN